MPHIQSKSYLLRNFHYDNEQSLRVRKGGGGSRGVLSRAERITKLKNLEKWEDGQSPLGLPKVRVYKISMKKKKAKDDSETAESE